MTNDNNNNNQVHQYETCVSTGPQHLNPDSDDYWSFGPGAKPSPEFGTPVEEILTIGETAQQQHPELLPAEAIMAFAFGLGFINRLKD